MQAPEDLVRKYRGRFTEGWETLREARFERQKALGLFDESIALPEWQSNHRKWEDLTDKEKSWEDYRMAIYAAMVESIDRNLGRLKQELEDTGQWDNTLFLFMSDNGANPFERSGFEDVLPWKPRCAMSQGTEWASVSNTPFRWYKQNTYMGGVTTPFIVHWPAGLTAEQWDDTPSHIVDIMPTLLELSGGEYPETMRGETMGPMVGKSLVPLFEGQAITREEPLFYSYVGSTALWDGQYRLVSNRGGPWELYDIDTDPVENFDIAASEPERVEAMSEEWYQIGNAIGVHADSRAPRKETSTPWGSSSDEEHPNWSGTPPLLLGNIPILASLTPRNNATNAPHNNPFVATFDRPVQVGSGTILLKRLSDDFEVESFDVTDTAKVHFNGNSVWLVPSNHLELSTAYYIEIPETAVQSSDTSFFYEGFSGNSHWGFSTYTTIPPSVVLVNSASKVVASSRNGKVTSFGFDASASASADMIVVAFSSQSFDSKYKIRYAGHTLDKAVSSNKAGIWYLDLTQTDYAGGSATLELDFTEGNAKGVSVGVVSLRASGERKGIDLHAAQLGTSSVDLTTTQNGAFNVVSFQTKQDVEEEVVAPSVNLPLTEIYASDNIGKAQGAAGYQENVRAGKHNYSWVSSVFNSKESAAAAFVLRDHSFSGWAERNDLGAGSGLEDDPDGDGVPNGIEAVFGSNPGEASSGLVAMNVNGEQISFTHPQADTLPTGLQLSYSWSVDLINWYDSDGVDGPASGGTVSVSSELVDGTNTVTVTPSAELDCLYLRAKVQEK